MRLNWDMKGNWGLFFLSIIFKFFVLSNSSLEFTISQTSRTFNRHPWVGISLNYTQGEKQTEKPRCREKERDSKKREKQKHVHYSGKQRISMDELRGGERENPTPRFLQSSAAFIPAHRLVGKLTRIYAESKVSEVFYLFVEVTRLWKRCEAMRKEGRGRRRRDKD